MPGHISVWEADPFYDAAESVQNSADRLLSLFNFWQRLIQGDQTPDHTKDLKRKELVTALDTVEWQLQEFERAVWDTAAASKRFRSAVADLKRRQQFISVLTEQVQKVRNALAECGCRSSELDKQDEDELASFLGGNSRELSDKAGYGEELVVVIREPGSNDLREEQDVIGLGETASDLDDAVTEMKSLGHATREDELFRGGEIDLDDAQGASSHESAKVDLEMGLGPHLRWRTGYKAETKAGGGEGQLRMSRQRYPIASFSLALLVLLGLHTAYMTAWSLQ